jgi:NADH-quinone oxidoreductase subunit B
MQAARTAAGPHGGAGACRVRSWYRPWRTLTSGIRDLGEPVTVGARRGLGREDATFIAAAPAGAGGIGCPVTGWDQAMGIEEKLPSGVLLTTVEKLAGYARKSSVWPATFGLACCAIELFSAGGPRHDLARFGMERASATPRQADLMIVAGRVSQKMAPVLRQIYDQMSEPKWVIAMGVCASSGGMFNNYAIVQGVDHIVPVDIYLPGCPPRPEMLLYAIVKLHDKIQNMKLGADREREITELEQASLRRLPRLPAESGPTPDQDAQ